MLFRRYAPAAALALIALVIWLRWLWQPERQVRLHTAHFLKKVERRNWPAARDFMAADYSDRWGHDRETALSDAREAFRSFLFLTIENRTESELVDERTGVARTTIKITGNGGPVAQLVMERVNTLTRPFIFQWRRESWQPWNWQLVSVDQPELDVSRVQF